MKYLIALFTMLCTVTAAFACSTSLFYDDEGGLVINIPEELDHTWYVTNYQLGLEIHVFNSSFMEDNFYITSITKVPLDTVDETDQIAFCASLCEQIGIDFPSFSYCSENEDKTCIETDDVHFSFQCLPSLVDTNGCVKRVRFSLSDLEKEGQFMADVHFFIKDGYAYAILTGIYGQDLSDEQPLEELSTSVASSIRFISSDSYYK